MEDAHISVAVDADTSVYGVFDGHGGKEVALFVKNHFVDELKKNQAFKDKNMKVALREVFLKMDELLQTTEG